VRYRVRVKPLNEAFRAGSDLDARLARVAVLYEDLRLETLAASADSIARLDASGREFRKSYSCDGQSPHL
jgi:hypothetical protein